jgi:ElaB/YqjD/DUF883 family membrane-anchored ribosome-binding protein
LYLTQETQVDNSTQGNKPSTFGMPNDTDGTLNKASSGAHATVNSIAEAADEATRKVKPAIDRVSEMARNAVDKAADVAAPTADWLSEQGESLSATQKKLVEDTCKYVSANPLKAIGAALAAGFLLSRIIR